MYRQKHAEGSAAGTDMHVGRSITMKHMLVREIMYAVLLGVLRGSCSLRNMSLECEADLDFDPRQTRSLSNFSVIRTGLDLLSFLCSVLTAVTTSQRLHGLIAMIKSPCSQKISNLVCLLYLAIRKTTGKIDNVFEQFPCQDKI